MDDYECIKFASLFHDIGKFYQRADNLGRSKHAYDSKYEKLDKTDYGKSGAHAKWSADFVRDKFGEKVENLVLYHHEPKNSDYPELCKIVQKADHHSSKERISSGEKNDVLLTPLTSIFSRISLDGKKGDEFYVPLCELDFNKSLYPQSEKVREGGNLLPEYQHLWAKFESEFESLETKDFETVLALLRKYTSTVPSATYYAESDISLFDHLKTTVAIANCRYLFSKENKLTQSDNQSVYKVINGDISGIQNFIYRVHTPEEASSGMSKRLRGRSLYLTLLCEAISNKIINDLNIDSSNILFCGGGRFTIIAPNTSKTDEVIKNIDLEVNKEFIDKFNAELFLNIVSTPACGVDLANFDNVLSKLKGLLNENKKHKFLNQLDSVFEVDDEIVYNLCPVCGNKAHDDFCKSCQEHEKLGAAVTNAKYLISYISEFKINKGIYFDKLNIGYIFKKSKKDIINLVNENSDINFMIYKLNDTNFLEIMCEINNKNVSYNFKVLGNSIPHINSKPLYFNHLAEISKGANKLGVLKMDVDNLGLIFSMGFKEIVGGASISRVSSLSFYLDLFFSGIINQIIEKFSFITNESYEDIESKIKINFEGDKKTIYRPKNNISKDAGTSTIHINYSGGDDLLVVGPYDDIIEFAQEFRNEFKKWTANNDSINISAGISIVGSKFPIGKAALMADRELEKSKDCGRDKITVFGEVLSWDSNSNIIGFKELLEFGKYLESLKENNHISSGFIYSLLKIWNVRSNVEPLKRFNYNSWSDKNIEKLQKKHYIPIFKYKLRTIKKYEIKDELDKKGLKYMPWIKTPVSWASLRLR